MIAVDTSALMAIYLDEPDAMRFTTALADAGRWIVGAPIAFEFLVVAERKKGPAGRALADTLLALPGGAIVDWTIPMMHAARDAHQRYGKGLHPAALNFGDCMAYAVAAVAGVPLLFKGDDFARTDIARAV